MLSAIVCPIGPARPSAAAAAPSKGRLSDGERTARPSLTMDSLVVAPVTPRQQMPVNLVRVIIGEVGEASEKMRIAAVLDRRSAARRVGRSASRRPARQIRRSARWSSRNRPLPDHCESRPQQARDVTGETFKSIASLGQIYGLVIDAGDARLVPADVAQDALNDLRNDIEPFVQNR